MSNLYFDLVKNDKYNINNIPYKYLTKEICYYIIDNYSLQYVPEPIINEDLVLYAITKAVNSSSNTYHIPNKYFTSHYREFYLKLAENKQVIFKKIPEDIYTNELALDLIKINPLYIMHMPKKFITKEVALIFANTVYNYSNRCFIPAEIINNDLDILNIYKQRFPEETNFIKKINTKKCLLNDVPKVYIDKDFCLQAVKACVSNLAYVPKNILDKDIIAQVNLNEIAKNPIILKIVDNFNNFTNYWDCCDKKIFYSIDSIDVLLKELVGPNCFYKEDDCSYTIYENVQKVIPGYIYNSYENVETKRYIIFKKN